MAGLKEMQVKQDFIGLTMSSNNGISWQTRSALTIRSVLHLQSYYDSYFYQVLLFFGIY